MQIFGQKIIPIALTPHAVHKYDKVITNKLFHCNCDNKLLDINWRQIFPTPTTCILLLKGCLRNT